MDYKIVFIILTPWRKKNPKIFNHYIYVYKCLKSTLNFKIKPKIHTNNSKIYILVSISDERQKV